MKTLNVIYNCSINVMGGAVQNAVNFICNVEARPRNNIVFHYLLSEAVYTQVKNILKSDNYTVVKSPAKSFLARRKIKQLVNIIKPDIVYTNAGPAYVKFNCCHIMGCSNPYLLEPSDYALRLGTSFVERFKRKIHTLYQKYHIKYADFYIFQTKTSQLSFKVNASISKSFVVSNAVSKKFFNIPFTIRKQPENISLFVPSAFYKHKNLGITVEALSILNTMFNSRYNLVFTLPEDIYQEHIMPLIDIYGLQKSVKNIGPYSHDDAPDLYTKYDIVIQPSVLEVFSTTYLEAIVSGLPLVVSRMPFSVEICDDYAYYFDVDCAKSLADAIVESSAFYEDIDSKRALSDKIISRYGDQSNRVDELLNILEKVSE